MNIEALQTLVDSVSGLWVQFEQSTTFTLVVIIVVSVVLIYNLSENVSSLEVRVLFILLSVAIAYAVGTNASVIFITLNLDQIYRDFFLNLSADMFVALFIPLVYVTWFQHRSLWRVFFTAFVICALFWLAVVYLPPLMADEFKLSRAFLNNLKLEIVAGFVTAVLGICILHIARVVRAMTKYERTSDDFIHLAMSLICLGFVVLLLWLSTYLPRAMFHTLSLTAVGTIITTVLLTHWTTKDKFLYRIVAFVLIAASSILLLDIANYDRNFALNLSSEFIGALLTTFLADGASL